MLGRALRAAFAALAARAQEPVHGGYRAQVLALLQQALIDRRRRLIAVRLAVQRRQHLGALLLAQRARLGAVLA